MSKHAEQVRIPQSFVVLMRDGSQTRLTFQMVYEGPREDLAILVPFGTEAEGASLRPVSESLIRRLDRLSAPRVVELWEQDPCTQASPWDYARPRTADGTEPDVLNLVTLSQSQASPITDAIVSQGYQLAPAVQNVLQENQKFLLIKVDASKLHFERNRAALPALSMLYSSDRPRLPVGEMLAGVAGPHELFLYVLAKDQRYEVADITNVTISTNLDVTADARENLPAFYHSLFDRTLEAHANAMVTEYAWESTSCDACPVAPLTPAELTALGADDLLGNQPPATTEGFRLRTDVPEADEGWDADAVAMVVRARRNEIEQCYQDRMRAGEDFPTQATFELRVNNKGQVVDEPQVVQRSVRAAAFEQCIGNTIRGWVFPTTSPVSVAAKVRFDWIAIHGVPANAAGWILTRMHTRFGEGQAPRELVLHGAAPLSGGREQWDDVGLEAGAIGSRINAFQARYVIRHAWAGEIGCDHPTRHVYGPAPHARKAPEPAAALWSAGAANLQLENVLLQDVLALGVRAKRQRESLPNPAHDSGCGSCVASKGFAGTLPSEAMNPYWSIFVALLVACSSLVVARSAKRSRSRPRS